jgi:hypothetical protein
MTDCTCTELERVAGHFCDACRASIVNEISPTAAELEKEIAEIVRPKERD